MQTLNPSRKCCHTHIINNYQCRLTISLPFSFRDVSIAISNLLQANTSRWRQGSHSSQTYHSGVSPRGYALVCAPRGHALVCAPRGHALVCAPRGHAMGGSSRDHCRYARVGISPHLDSCCLWFFLSISLL